MTPSSLFYVPEGSCSSLSFLDPPPAPQGERSLFGKLVSRARSSQVAHALGTLMSSARPYLLIYSVGFLFVRLAGESQVYRRKMCFGKELFQDSLLVWFWFCFFLSSFWHGEWLNQGKRSEAGRCHSEFVVWCMVQVMFGCFPQYFHYPSYTQCGLGSRSWIHSFPLGSKPLYRVGLRVCPCAPVCWEPV